MECILEGRKQRHAPRMAGSACGAWEKGKARAGRTTGVADGSRLRPLLAGVVYGRRIRASAPASTEASATGTKQADEADDDEVDGDDVVQHPRHH